MAVSIIDVQIEPLHIVQCTLIVCLLPSARINQRIPWISAGRLPVRGAIASARCGVPGAKPTAGRECRPNIQSQWHFPRFHILELWPRSIREWYVAAGTAMGGFRQSGEWFSTLSPYVCECVSADSMDVVYVFSVACTDHQRAIRRQHEERRRRGGRKEGERHQNGGELSCVLV